ncbi:MAG: hypothetical protein JW891_01105 [Candidatus Lokiarchaeota archaeon]|nr:hypothetical protein [Candidatus Lokiarchaeota archaeon]
MMVQKFSPKVQQEIQYLFHKIKIWETLFFFEFEYYFDGWAITLKEKSMYPRIIILFKSYDTNSYSIKSFEVHNKEDGKNEYEELYYVNKIQSEDKLVKELRDVINGKDLMYCVRSKFKQNE